MFDLTGRTALVTGASRGLGAEVATLLSGLGASVAVNYPTASERSDARAVVDDLPGGGVAVRGDVADAGDVGAMFDTVADDLGEPDVLVNNAGVGGARPIEDLDEATWDRTIAVDLKGVFLCSREAVARMDCSRDDPGRIVNVASQLAFEGAAGLTHYCAAKGGVVSFTRALAREVAPEITVNAVAPGPMPTAMLREGSTEAWRAEKREEIPLGRFGDPAEVAPTIAFLASEAASYYTGQTLSPDGGDAMH